MARYEFTLTQTGLTAVYSEVFVIDRPFIVFQATFSQVSEVNTVIQVSCTPGTLTTFETNVISDDIDAVGTTILEREDYATHCRVGIVPKSTASGNSVASCVVIT